MQATPRDHVPSAARPNPIQEQKCRLGPVDLSERTSRPVVDCVVLPCPTRPARVRPNPLDRDRDVHPEDPPTIPSVTPYYPRWDTPGDRYLMTCHPRWATQGLVPPSDSRGDCDPSSDPSPDPSTVPLGDLP